MVRLAGSAGKAPIVWQESFDQGVPLPPGTRVQVWKWWRESAAPASSAAAAGAEAGGGLAAARRLAAERPDAEAAQHLQRATAAAEPAAAAAPSCALEQGCTGSGGPAEAWKAELQVGGCACGAP